MVEHFRPLWFFRPLAHQNRPLGGDSAHFENHWFNQTHNAAMFSFNQWRSQPKFFLGKKLEGPRCLILGEQQYFVLDTTSQRTKSPVNLKMLVGHGLLGPLGYAYANKCKTFALQLVRSLTPSFPGILFVWR